MALTKENYRTRLLDKKIERYLRVFGAVSIEGPKWCGKTWTSLNHSSSVSYLTEQSVRDLAEVSPKYIFNKDKPQLIDEWQLVPNIWDAVRHECDSDNKTGKFILTGSTTLNNEESKNVFHSGAERIARLKMYTMSLYETGDSKGEVSITDMLNGTVKCGYVGKVELDLIAKFIVRGGWPNNLDKSDEDIDLIPKSYIDSVLSKDINEGDKARDKNKMMMVLRSLARNESTLVGSKTIIKDIEEYENEEELIGSRNTIIDYIDVLNRLHLIENQEAFSLNYRSSARVGKVAKRHFTDPSLVCACLDLSVSKLLLDFNTFGFLFESLVEHDLRVYMNYLDGSLYHFRDNVSRDEVDSILEFKNGDYAAVEIKLTSKGIEEAKKSLVTFYENVKVKPKFMCIIVGYYEAIIKDEETGIYIVPLTSLMP